MSPATRVLVCAALLAAVVVALGWRITHAELRHRSEKRTVAIATEMLERDAWLVPTLGGRARLQKPPLYSWVTASAASLAGGPSLVALRAVSAVSGLALLALVFAWGYSLGGYDCAIASAVSLIAMGQFWWSSTHATADILLAVFSTAALFAFERRRLPALALLFALSFLTKATAALVNVLVPVGIWLFAVNELRLTLHPRVLTWGALAAGLSLAWYAAVLLLVPEAPRLLREFLLVPQKARHYLLPVLPLFALLCGDWISRSRAQRGL